MEVDGREDAGVGELHVRTVSLSSDAAVHLHHEPYPLWEAFL